MKEKKTKNRFVFLQLPISKHREFKQQRTPKLVVDLLFKKKKKFEESKIFQK